MKLNIHDFMNSASFKILLLLSVLIHHSGGENLKLTAEGCGMKADSVRLLCPPEGIKVRIIDIDLVKTTYKVQCPQGQSSSDCDRVLDPSNSFYQKVLNSCQDKVSCYVTAEPIPIPLCAGTIHISNYISIDYFCILTGQTVTTTKSATTKITNATSTQTYLPRSTSANYSTANESVIAPQSTGNDNLALKVVLPIILIIAIIAMVIITAFLYRLKKCPLSVQHSLERKIMWARIKSADVKGCCLSTAKNVKDRAIQIVPIKKQFQSKQQAPADAEDNQDSYYRDWNDITLPTASSNNKPKILMTSHENGKSGTGKSDNPHSKSAEGDDFSDSEFDSDPDEIYALPAEPEEEYEDQTEQPFPRYEASSPYAKDANGEHEYSTCADNYRENKSSFKSQNPEPAESYYYADQSCKIDYEDEYYSIAECHAPASRQTSTAPESYDTPLPVK